MSRGGPSLTVAILVLALAVGGVAAALLATQTGGGSGKPVTAVAQSSAGPTATTGSGDTASTATTATTATKATTNTNTNTTATTDTTTSTNTTTTTGATTPTPPPSLGPAGALHRYWQLMNNQRYSQAYARETSHLQGLFPDFVSVRSQAAAHINVVSVGTPTYTSPQHADVPIEFYAQDTVPVQGSDTSCRHYNTTAHMVQGGSIWYYDGILPGSGIVVPSNDPHCHG